MKYLCLILILMFINACLYSQDRPSKKRKDSEYHKIKPNYLPKSDKKHRNLKDLSGLKQGLWKSYTRDKVLILEVDYKNNKRHGRYARYHPRTGLLVDERNYFYGKKDGAYNKFTYSGQSVIEGEYKEGRKDGEWRYFYTTSGTLKSEGKYKNGKKIGVWKYYNKKEEETKSIDYDELNKPPPPMPITPPAKKVERKTKDGKRILTKEEVAKMKKQKAAGK